MNWRIDMKMQSRNGEQVNMPTAIVQLQVANEHSSSVSLKLKHFSHVYMSLSDTRMLTVIATLR